MSHPAPNPQDPNRNPNQQPNQNPSYQPTGAGAQHPNTIYVQAPKKPWYQRVGCIVSIVAVVFLVLIIGGCSALLFGTANEVDKSLNEEHTITYRIEGDAQDATATFNVDETNTSQESGIAAGWQREVTIKGIFGGYLSVTNGINDTGTITCQIISNGQVISENTASGEFASTSCSASSDDFK